MKLSFTDKIRIFSSPKKYAIIVPQSMGRYKLYLTDNPKRYPRIYKYIERLEIETEEAKKQLTEIGNINFKP